MYLYSTNQNKSIINNFYFCFFDFYELFLSLSCPFHFPQAPVGGKSPRAWGKWKGQERERKSPLRVNKWAPVGPPYGSGPPFGGPLAPYGCTGGGPLVKGGNSAKLIPPFSFHFLLPFPFPIPFPPPPGGGRKGNGQGEKAYFPFFFHQLFPFFPINLSLFPVEGGGKINRKEGKRLIGKNE